MDKKDAEFMKETSKAALDQASVSSHLILWTALLFVVVALIWANIATLDEITRGNGKVIPSTDMQVIQNLEGGIVKEILVREGEVVQKNQILMVIDDTRFVSSYQENQVKVAALEGRLARLLAEVQEKALIFPKTFETKFPQVVADEMTLYNSRQKERQARINILSEQKKEKTQELIENKRRLEQLTESHSLVRRELNITRPLVKQGVVSEVEVLRLERTVNDLAGDLAAAKLAIPRLEAATQGVEKRIEETKIAFRSDAQDQLNEAKAEWSALKQTSIAEEDRIDRTLVRSPVRGTVNQIKVSTIGGILQPGEDMVEIVPLGDSLLIEAEIKPQDIGFLRPGLVATVKITAYDFSIYGGLKGVVEHISADTIINEEKEHMYQILVRTDQTFLKKHGKKFEIMPGMRASVDILTGKKTVLDYLLKPILKTKEKALTER